MGTSVSRTINWGKIGTLCSLKAIALACFLTPATVVLPTTPALAQLVIPGFFGFRYRGRHHYYGRRYSRHRYSRYSRYRRRPGGEEPPGEVSPSSSSGTPPSGAPTVAPAPSGTSSKTNKKLPGTSDN
jgi:hypothetical protein